MLTNKTGVKKKILISLIYLMIGSSGIFLSFKSVAFSGSKNVKASQADSWSDDLTWWVKGVLNHGDGYNFAIEKDENSRASNFHAEKPPVQVSLVRNYSILLEESPLLFGTDNLNAVKTPEATGVEGSALATISPYLPSDVRGTISEEQAQQLVDKAATLPSKLIEKVKNDPELLARAKSMGINALLNYQVR